MIVHCHFCNAELETDNVTVWRRVVGWEHKARSGNRRGGSDITLRERRDEWACHPCVDSLKRGISPQQGALL